MAGHGHRCLVHASSELSLCCLEVGPSGPMGRRAVKAGGSGRRAGVGWQAAGRRHRVAGQAFPFQPLGFRLCCEEVCPRVSGPSLCLFLQAPRGPLEFWAAASPQSEWGWGLAGPAGAGEGPVTSRVCKRCPRSAVCVGGGFSIEDCGEEARGRGGGQAACGQGPRRRTPPAGAHLSSLWL